MQKYPQKSLHDWQEEYWHCTRKRFYFEREKADKTATKLGCDVYKCRYGNHYHVGNKKPQESENTLDTENIEVYSADRI